MREALRFVKQLHEYYERNVDKPGPWCWPTRDLVNENLWVNKAKFPRDKNVRHSFNRQLGVARSRGWMTVGPCESHCHADHVKLTGLGLDMLELMEQQGCETGEHTTLSGARLYEFHRKKIA